MKRRKASMMLFLYVSLSLSLAFSSTPSLWKVEPSLFRSHAVQREPLTILPWKDVPQEHWATPYLQDLYRKGILEGVPGAFFEGNRPLTRYEAAVMIDRTIAYFYKLLQQP